MECVVTVMPVVDLLPGLQTEEVGRSIELITCLDKVRLRLFMRSMEARYDSIGGGQNWPTSGLHLRKDYVCRFHVASALILIRALDR